MLKSSHPKTTLAKERQIFSNRDLVRLIVPLLVEQLLMLLVGIIDTLMISYAGETAVSGVSLVNQINAVFIAVFAALASGGAVVISQYIGKKDKENGAAAAGQLILLAVLVSAGILIGITVFCNGLLGALFGRVEPEVMNASRIYLFITALSFPALAVYNSCSSILRSMSLTKATMYVSMGMNLINVVGNYIGVFVLKAGVTGVAVPSLISRMAAAAVMLVLCADRKHTVYWRAKDLFRFHKDILRRIIGIAVPNGIESGMLNVSKVALSSIIALFGTVQIAANGVAQNFWSVSALFSIVMGPVFITVIGRCMGGGDLEAAQYYVKKLMCITYVGCFVWNTVSFLLTWPILQLYSLSPQTVRLILILCLMHNIMNTLLHPSGFVLANALRAAGDVKFTMYTSIFATVVVRVIFAMVFGVWCGGGVIGVAVAMGCDWLVRAVLILARYKQGRWKTMRVV